MSGEELHSKEEKFEEVAHAAVMIVAKKGLKELNHSSLSRKSGVSRAWLYKYLGKEQSDVLQFAVERIADTFSEINDPGAYQAQKWIPNILEATDRFLDKAENFPWIIDLYYRERAKENILGETFRGKEEQFVAKISGELVTAYSVDSHRASFLIRMMMGFQMNLAWQWLQSSEKDKKTKTELLNFFRDYLEWTVSDKERVSSESKT